MSNVEFEDSENQAQYIQTKIDDAKKRSVMVKFLEKFGVKSEKLATMILIAVACLFFLLSIYFTLSAI